MGAQLAYLFPFSDQVLYPRTMGARTAITKLAIQPKWLARGLAVMGRTGASRLMAIEGSVMQSRDDTGWSAKQGRSIRAPRGCQTRRSLEDRDTSRRAQADAAAGSCRSGAITDRGRGCRTWRLDA